MVGHPLVRRANWYFRYWMILVHWRETLIILNFCRETNPYQLFRHCEDSEKNQPSALNEWKITTWWRGGRDVTNRRIHSIMVICGNLIFSRFFQKIFHKTNPLDKLLVRDIFENSFDKNKFNTLKYDCKQITLGGSFYEKR